ncbi:hypothetical protein H4R99_004114 [Coemansia sp. RSA 1722]|nr:hypothetical protein LPJ57_008551 [Coemansia sp. RSA 486]KAJ2234650.1 hypothetical protein IWW45_003249 [Coemansia sp. RSA 485]KAJ2598435.1 hypothetical protein H4R99_004114 [Coemansia sp. RSA 1722]
MSAVKPPELEAIVSNEEQTEGSGISLNKDKELSGCDPEEEDNDEEDQAIFVAEDLYAPLEDHDDEHDSHLFDNDAFATSRLPPSAHTLLKNSSRIPIDLEQFLDDRIDQEIALKEGTVFAAAAVSEESLTTADRDLKETAGRFSDKSRPLEVNVSAPMSAEHISQIKDIMAGIQLSKAAIPEWAKRVPESSWMPKRRQATGDSTER